jgi:hypothetical protein
VRYYLVEEVAQQARGNVRNPQARSTIFTDASTASLVPIKEIERKTAGKLIVLA